MYCRIGTYIMSVSLVVYCPHFYRLYHMEFPIHTYWLVSIVFSKSHHIPFLKATSVLLITWASKLFLTIFFYLLHLIYPHQTSYLAYWEFQFLIKCLSLLFFKFIYSICFLSYMFVLYRCNYSTLICFFCLSFYFPTRLPGISSLKHFHWKFHSFSSLYMFLTHLKSVCPGKFQMCIFSATLRPLHTATVNHTNLKAIATIKFKVSNFVFAPNIAEQPFISFINFLILFTTLLKKFPVTYTSDSPTLFLTLRR